ncbi:MAG: SMC-Scp complex subunit ScpB [Bacteriovoracaceae bacterium]|nr:SMC-Scp complex subunit ScpB [Bacteriovoracaceae bacterium]
MDNNIEENFEQTDFIAQLGDVDAPQSEEDTLWPIRTGLDEDTLCGAIETIIFMSDKPVSLVHIKRVIDPDMPLKVVHKSIGRLQDQYEQTQHGIRLMEVAEGYQFRTKATYSKYIQALFKVNALMLTPSALEVLSIIAYKQPVSRPAIDKIRGVDSSHIVRNLMDKRLVKISGRSDDLGKPVVYGTTVEFLEVFNLADISELPPEYELETIADEGVGQISDIKDITYGNNTRNFEYDEIEELDRLSASIKSISSETDFTKSLKIEDKKRLTQEGHVAKSAFDLLEEFQMQDEVQRQNEQASNSELILPIIDANVIPDLKIGPFNIPEASEFPLDEEISEQPQ